MSQYFDGDQSRLTCYGEAVTQFENLNRVERTYRNLTANGAKIIKLFSGNPNECGFHFPPEILTRAYADFFSSPEYQPHPKGLRSAREAVAGYYEGQRCPVDPENIILTSGTSESFFYLFSLLSKPGDEILTSCPSYPLFDHIAHLTHVNLVHYGLDEKNDWVIDVQDLKRKTGAKTRAIVIISPHNPTGMVVSEGQLREIVDWANERGLALICDEVFLEFYFGSGSFPRMIAVAKPDLCFTLNGISKMFALPALKLSWIVVSGKEKQVADAIDSLETTADTFLSSQYPMQKILPTLFSEGGKFVVAYRNEVKKRRDLAVGILRNCPEIRVVPPAGGFYLTVSVTKPVSSSEEEFVIRLMEEESVFVHPGYFYDYEKGIHFVISFLPPEEILRPSLQKICRFVNAL